MQDITIAEGGVARTMGQVAKLVTNLQGGGMCSWVPEDERKTTTKHITENGVYNPADDDVYGYSKVTVRVPQGVSGTAHGVTGGFDVDDGEEYFIENVDGNLVFTEVPASIAVTTPPTKTDYSDGDIIDFTGIVVTAYHADGSAFDIEDYPGGIIPFGELVFPVTTAHAGSGESGNIYENDDTEIEVDGSIISGPVSYVEATSTLYGEGGTQIGIDTADGSPVVIETSREETTFRITELFDTTYSKHALLVTMGGSSSPGSVYISSKSIGVSTGLSSAMSIDGKTVIYASIDTDGIQRFSTSTDSGSISHNLIGKLAWFLWNGDGFTPKGNQSVPVNWPRFGDDQTLEASFPINVTPFEGWGDNTGDGGSTSGGGGF